MYSKGAEIAASGVRGAAGAQARPAGMADDSAAASMDDFDDSSDGEVRASQHAAKSKKPPLAAVVSYQQAGANVELPQFLAPAGGSKQYRGDSILKVKSQIEYGEEQDNDQYDYGDELPNRTFADGRKESHKKSSKAEERKQPEIHIGKTIELTNMDLNGEQKAEQIGFAGKEDADYDTRLHQGKKVSDVLSNSQSQRSDRYRVDQFNSKEEQTEIQKQIQREKQQVAADHDYALQVSQRRTVKEAPKTIHADRQEQSQKQGIQSNRKEGEQRVAGQRQQSSRNQQSHREEENGNQASKRSLNQMEDQEWEKISIPSDIDEADEQHGKDEQDEEAVARKRAVSLKKRAYLANADIFEENEELISYLKLKRNIQQNHPVNEVGARYGICAEIGYLPCCTGCFRRRYNAAKKKDEIEVTRIQQQIGLGPTLLLQATKALAWLFFFITVLNIPVYAFYYGGNVANTENAEAHGAQNFQGAFAMVSLGNIGQDQDACGGANVLREPALKLSCSYGQLEALLSFGLALDDDSIKTCSDTAAQKQAISTKASESTAGEVAYLQQSCGLLADGPEATLAGSLFARSDARYPYNAPLEYPYTGAMPTEDFAAQLEEYFRLNCKGKAGCHIPVTRPQPSTKTPTKASTTSGQMKAKKDAAAKGSSTADSELSELEYVWTRSVDDGTQKRQEPVYLDEVYSGPSPLSKECQEVLRARSSASPYNSTSTAREQRSKAYKSPLPEPVVLAQAVCLADGVPIPWLNARLRKDDFGVFVVGVDFLVVVTLICFIYILDGRQQEFIDQFNNRTIMMTDYTIRIKNLPNDFEYGDRDEILRAQLWAHLENILTEENNFERQGDAKQKMLVPRSCQIVDITFGKEKLGDTAALVELNELHQEAQSNRLKLERSPSKRGKSRYEKKVKGLEDAYARSKSKYLEHQQQVQAEAGQASKGARSIKYAYVVFRSMDGMNKVLNAYNITSFYRILYMYICPTCCCGQNQKKTRALYFNGRWLKVSKACLPDEIKWENIGYGACNRRIRKIFIWLIAIIMIGLGIVGVVFMKVKSDGMKKEFQTQIACPEAQSTSYADKRAAYIDYEKDVELRQGLMHCYCLEVYRQIGGFEGLQDVQNVDFTDVQEGAKNLCVDWFKVYAAQQALVIGTSAVVVGINVVICFIFELISKAEKHHTQNDETLGQFQKITIMQFINIAIIILLVNFNVGDMFADVEIGHEQGLTPAGLLQNLKLDEVVPVLAGDYTDFSALWYYNVGATLCVTLSMNIFSPHLGKVAQPMLSCVQRCWDRRGACYIKKERKNNKDDQCNTNKELQSELQALYTGPQISSHYVYAQLFTNLWSCLMYSSGLPILYPVACMFYFVLYWLYKGLLLKHYQRTSRFNEQLAITSVGYIKFGILFHLVLGAFMYSNSRILSASQEAAVYDVSGYVLEGSALTYYRDRFRSTHAQLYFAVGVILLLLYIFQSVIIKIILKYLCKCLSCDCCRRHAQDFAVKDRRRDNFSEDILLEFEISNLTELYKRSIRDLNEYEDMLTTSNFDKILLKPAHAQAFSKEVQDGHLEQLRLRKRHIEETVQSHLVRLLQGSTKNPQKMMTGGRDPAAKYASYTCNQKLLLLLANQTKLARVSQSKSSQGDRLRMQGTTQSYDIHDSAQYRAAKRMQRQLAKEDYEQAAGRAPHPPSQQSGSKLLPPAQGLPKKSPIQPTNIKPAAPKIQKTKLAK